MDGALGAAEGKKSLQSQFSKIYEGVILLKLLCQLFRQTVAPINLVFVYAVWFLKVRASLHRGLKMFLPVEWCVEQLKQ